ncbi:hypothetical protein HAX54_014990 [Datura stramonium]|uniref:Uncharacterized protein n=1 Tax=Datura stramonium TaxID=4076 RepID=A0ABS8TS66_DATST|nr:hypothetical protein [Datura stramonium]
MVVAAIVDQRRVNIGGLLANELKKMTLQTDTSLPYTCLITALCNQAKVPTLQREDHIIEDRQVIHITNIRDGTRIIVQHHLSFPMTVGGEPDTEGVHIEVPLNVAKPSIDMSPPPDASKADLAYLAPQGASSSNSTPHPAPVAPCRATTTLGALSRLRIAMTDLLQRSMATIVDCLAPVIAQTSNRPPEFSLGVP